MLKSNREDLPTILGMQDVGKAGDLFSSSSLRDTKLHETYRSEKNDRQSLPNVIIPESDDLDDFFATIATFYEDIMPLSSSVFVLNSATTSLLKGTIKSFRPRFDSEDKYIRTAMIGASMGEAILMGLNLVEKGGAPSYSACTRTLSHTLCRGSILYGKKLNAELLMSRWVRLRKISMLDVSSKVTEAIFFIHALLTSSMALSNNNYENKLLEEAILLLAKNHEFNNHNNKILWILCDLYPEIRSFIEALEGPFDERMAVFTRIVSVIQKGTRGVRIDEIAVAYFCNAIFPGSFAHTPVLAKLINFFPAALVWYGVFSILTKPNSAKSVQSGLYTKLERDLLEEFSFEQRPRCDISIEEFEVISRTAFRTESIRPSQQRILYVSLLPGVNIYTRLGVEEHARIEQTLRDSEMERLNNHVEKLLVEALSVLKEGSTNKRNAVRSPSRLSRKDY